MPMLTQEWDNIVQMLSVFLNSSTNVRRHNLAPLELRPYLSFFFLSDEFFSTDHVQHIYFIDLLEPLCYL